MSALVYRAITAVTADLAETGISKRHRNEQSKYHYRSIEDVLNALAPLLPRHQLCVLPRVLERQALSVSQEGKTVQLVSVRAAFDLVSAIDGSMHSVESFGEAIDEGDKGTAKAISSAFKSAMLQAFCIPVPQEDADAKSPRLNGVALPEPPEGWNSWSGEVIDIVKSCESTDAVERLCTSRRSSLGALQRARPDLYAKVGEEIAAKVAELQRPNESKPQSKKSVGKQRKGAASASRQPAEAA